MPGIAGKRSRLLVATASAGPYNPVLGLKQISYSIDGSNIDDSEMTVDWMQRLQGLKDGKASASGNRNPANTNGQNVLLSALLNDTDVWIRVLPDNGATANAGFQQQVRVAKFATDASIDGPVSLSIELEGTGPATLV